MKSPLMIIKLFASLPTDFNNPRKKNKNEKKATSLKHDKEQPLNLLNCSFEFEWRAYSESNREQRLRRPPCYPLHHMPDNPSLRFLFELIGPQTIIYRN